MLDGVTFTTGDMLITTLLLIGGWFMGPPAAAPRTSQNGGGIVIAIRDLAGELRLTVPSVTYHCRSRGIETCRRLPEGARGGQMLAFVTDADADAIRLHYADRLSDRSG